MVMHKGTLFFLTDFSGFWASDPGPFLDVSLGGAGVDALI